MPYFDDPKWSHMDSRQMTTEIEDLIPSVGAHNGVLFGQYRAWRAVNWSTLKSFRTSARQGRYEMAIPQDSSEDMIFGGAFHAKILEPLFFEATYAVMPKFPGHHSSTIHKNAKTEWTEANIEKVPLTRDESVRLEGMHKAVLEHPTTAALLTGKGRNEFSVAWNDKESGLLMKARIDRLTRVSAKVIDATLAGNVVCIVDFKKTSKFHQFEREVTKYGYHGQCAMYKDGIETLEPGTDVIPLLAVVQDDEPYDVKVYTMTDAVDHGGRLYRRCLNSLVCGRRENHWPGVCPFGTIPMVIAPWDAEATL